MMTGVAEGKLNIYINARDKNSIWKQFLIYEKRDTPIITGQSNMSLNVMMRRG